MFAVQDQVNTWEVGKCVMRRIVELSSAKVLYRTLFCLSILMKNGISCAPYSSMSVLKFHLNGCWHILLNLPVRFILAEMYH